MFRILVMNGLLMSLIIIWTSAEMETSPRTLIETPTDFQAEPLNSSESKPLVSLNKILMDIKGRQTSCISELGGVCIQKKKSCPSHLPSQKPRGKPYCSKNHRCCYQGISCNLEWNYERHRPLIMIRETKSIVPPVKDDDMSNDPSRIPEAVKLIFACPGENNQFENVEGTHTKLHGECTSHEQFKVCVNNYPEFLDLSELSCRRPMLPSITKQDNDTAYKKSCEDIGGELYKLGYIYGDYKEFKDLDNKICFSKKNQKTLWTSSNFNSNEISNGEQYMETPNNKTGRGFVMNNFFPQNSQKKIFKEVPGNEATLVWNDTTCRDHGGQCVREGITCPDDLPHQTSQGEPFCTNFYRCCYSDTLHLFKSSQEKRKVSKLLRAGKCGEGIPSFCSRPRSNQATRQHKKDCEVIWKSDYDGFAPLIFTGNCDEPTIIRDDKIKHVERIRFICPDASNSFEKNSFDNIDAECQDGKLWAEDGTTINIENVGCKSWVRASIRPERKPSIMPFPCANGMGLKYQIGFEAKFNNKAWFFELLDVCFDREEGTTLMVEHLLSPVKKADNKNPPDFRTSTGFFSVAMNMIYTQKSQAKLFSDEVLNLQQDIICDEKHPNLYLQRGHMAPKGDFVTKAEQDATFYYLNALPQWSTINNGNWKAVEDSIRKVQESQPYNLKIYTGGIDVLRLHDKYNRLVEIYLSDVYDEPKKKEKVPVPAFTWKVVHAETLKKAVAFVVMNNPFVKTPISFTRSQCHKLNWLTGTFPLPEKGYTYCFTVKDFKKTFLQMSFFSLGDADADENLLV